MAYSLSENIGQLQLSEGKEINILLLGETGVGKSTFINSIFNYFQFLSLDDAKANLSDLIHVIPARFTVTDSNGQVRNISLGNQRDANENLETGSSHTKGVNTYEIPISGGNMIRLIDTPGMGDTGGIKNDAINCDNILKYISRLKHLHAILYLMKAQQSRSTVYFEYCVQQILSRLNKSACSNIVFAFTHSRASNYEPDETFPLIKNVTRRIKENPPYADIPTDRNVFFFDNEAFKTLVALTHGINVPARVYRANVDSWETSRENFGSMLSYISNLAPHIIKSSVSVNKARHIISLLIKPITDIAQFVQDNIYALEIHEKKMKLYETNLNELKKHLYVPGYTLEREELDKPVTVCTETTCADLYDIGDGRKGWQYRTRCHDPCYLDDVPREIIGSPELTNCAAMDSSQMCGYCKHSYRQHMHVYYTTIVKKTKQMNTEVSENLTDQENILKNYRVTRDNITCHRKALDDELSTITRCNAKFAHFLACNALVPFSDSYQEYVKCLMERERGLGEHCDEDKMRSLQELLNEHAQMKNIFQEAAVILKQQLKPDLITPESIEEAKKELFRLKIMGKNIRELFEAQEALQQQEFQYSEYKHNNVFRSSRPNPKSGNGSRTITTRAPRRYQDMTEPNVTQTSSAGCSGGVSFNSPPPSYYDATALDSQQSIQERVPEPQRSGGQSSVDYESGATGLPPINITINIHGQQGQNSESIAQDVATAVQGALTSVVSGFPKDKKSEPKKY